MNQITQAISGSWWAYPLILAVCFGDAILPILPSETAVVTGGVLSGGKGLSLPLVIVFAAVGAFAGDNASYAIGRWAGPWARRTLFRGSKGTKTLAWAQKQLDERGAQIIVVARFIPGGRTATTFMAGATDFRYVRFARAAGLGAVIWATYAALIGRIGGKAFEGQTGKALLFAFVLALAGAGLVELVRHLLARRHARRHPATDTTPAEVEPAPRR